MTAIKLYLKFALLLSLSVPFSLFPARAIAANTATTPEQAYEQYRQRLCQFDVSTDRSLKSRVAKKVVDLYKEVTLIPLKLVKREDKNGTTLLSYGLASKPERNIRIISFKKVGGIWKIIQVDSHNCTESDMPKDLGQKLAADFSVEVSQFSMCLIIFFVSLFAATHWEISRQAFWVIALPFIVMCISLSIPRNILIGIKDGMIDSTQLITKQTELANKEFCDFALGPKSDSSRTEEED